VALANATGERSWRSLAPTEAETRAALEARLREAEEELRRRRG
jgi:hypothetical protein